MTVSQSLSHLRANPYEKLADAFEAELNTAISDYIYDDCWEVHFNFNDGFLKPELKATLEWPEFRSLVSHDEQDSGEFDIDLVEDNRFISLLNAIKSRLTDEVILSYARMSPQFKERGKELERVNGIEFCFCVDKRPILTS